ncbi:hypothetical protein KI387_030578, partial [Taxus chinensis]
MHVHGCCLVKPSSSSFSIGAAICMQSRWAFPEISFGATVYKIRTGGVHLKQRSIAKVNTTSALSTNTNSLLCIAEYRRYSKKPTRRKNKLRPKLLKTLPKPYIETLIQTDERSKIKLENVESTYKDEKNLEVDTFSEEGITAAVDETFSPLNLQDGDVSIDENKYITDDDMHQINAEKDILKNVLSLKDPLVKMWDSCNDWCTQYKKDVSTWGVGNTPIFVVHESGEGRVKVSINEGELFNRFVAQPFGKDERMMTTLGLKMAEAKLVARDIERGVVKPPRNSTVYHFLDTGLEKGGLSGSATYQATCNSVIGIGSAPRVLKNLQFGFLVLSGSLFVWAAWKFVSAYGTFSTEEDKQKKKQLAIKSFKSFMDENRTGFEKRILKIQDMARQARIVEQNSSEESDYSNSVRVEMVADDGRKEEDQALNSNVLRENNHGLGDPDVSDLPVLGSNAKLTMPKEVNTHVQNTLLAQQEGKSSINFREEGDRNGESEKTQQPKADVLQDGQSAAERAAHIAIKGTVNATHTDTSDLNVLGGNAEFILPKEVNIHVQNTPLAQQASEGISSVNCREEGDKNGKSEKTQTPKVNVLQDGQSSAERAVHNASKETINVTHAEKGLRKRKKINEKRVSVKGSHRIKPQVIAGAKEAREISVSEHGKHGNKSTDASNLSNKNTSLVKPVSTKQKSAMTKEELSSQLRIESKRYKKLKPVVRKVENVFEEKIGRRKALESGLENTLETAESKVKLDLGNMRDRVLQIEPTNGVPQGNDVLSQEAEELEWMRDEVLRKIVSKVQNNDIAGRGPSDGLVAEEELLFFRGLERKFRREGESVKSWIKERVDKLKYGKVLSGVDGASMFSTILSNDSTKEGRSIVSSKINKDHKMFTKDVTVDKEKSSFISEPISVSKSSSPTSTDFSNMEIDAKCKLHSGLDTSLAEESTGNASFSAEGKLKNEEIIREPEMVEQKKTVSKDNDHMQEMKKLLWWLDLPYVLCIVLYRNSGNNVLKGLYSLEMAPGPDSSTRPHHTIAFEDHADARNFCYILQSHFHELGDTRAHVIPLSTE